MEREPETEKKPQVMDRFDSGKKTPEEAVKSWNKKDEKRHDSQKYASNPKKGFNDALKKALERKEQ